MPYNSLADLPDSVKSVLPTHAQEIYFAAFNSAYEGTCKDREDKDACCASIAWAAVKNDYVQGEGGMWKKKSESESDGSDGRPSNTTTIFDEKSVSPLTPNFIREDGTAYIRIIKPGWGSSGYYSDAMLTRDAPAIYKAGTHMHLDHPMKESRPERSLRTLAAVLTEDGQYLENGPWGPGVYAHSKIFSPYRTFLNEIAPYIGISHRAAGNKKTGEAEGKKGDIIERLTKCYSVDFVTKPGAGGGLVEMFEAWRDRDDTDEGNEGQENTEQTTMEGNQMTKTKLTEQEPGVPAPAAGIAPAAGEPELMKRVEELTAENTALKARVAELEQEVARMKEKEAVGQAAAVAQAEVAKVDLPDVTKHRLQESLVKKAVVKEGKLDEPAFKELVAEAIRSETEYIQKLSEAGKVRGFGAVSGNATSKDALKESFKVAFIAEGMKPDDAEKRATLAVEGRR